MLRAENAYMPWAIVAALLSGNQRVALSPVPAKKYALCVTNTPALSAYAAGHALKAARDNDPGIRLQERYPR